MTAGSPTQHTGPAMVPISRVAPHPANPRQVFDQEALDELAASIAELGILQPLTVMPAERVGAQWPHDRADLGDASWVVLSGHRRRLAVQQAFSSEPDRLIPVWVRDGEICEEPLAQLDAICADNIAHEPLRPLEEARAFHRAVTAGRSQRQIARIWGCSQSHVSKRLMLLQLPAELQGALEQNQLMVKDAMAVAAKRGHPDDAAVEQHQPRGLEARKEEAEARARKEGVDLVDDAAVFGPGRDLRRLHDPDAIAQARAAGTLRAHVGPEGGLHYYTTKSEHQELPPDSAAPPQVTENWQVAARRRETAAMTLVAQPLSLPSSASDLVDAWLESANSNLWRLGHRWLTELGVDPAASAGRSPELQQWWHQMLRADWPTRLHVAYALTLARHEVRIRIHRSAWDAKDVAWVNRLVKSGYDPTPWEKERLDDARDVLPLARMPDLKSAM